MRSITVALLFHRLFEQCIAQTASEGSWQPPNLCYYDGTSEKSPKKICPDVATTADCYMVTRKFLRARYWRSMSNGLGFLNPSFTPIEESMVDPKTDETVVCGGKLPNWVKSVCHFINSQEFICAPRKAPLFNVRVSMSSEMVDVGTLDLRSDGDFFNFISTNNRDRRFASGLVYKNKVHTMKSGCGKERSGGDKDIQGSIKGQWGTLLENSDPDAKVLISDVENAKWLMGSLKAAIIQVAQANKYSVFTKCTNGGSMSWGTSLPCSGDNIDCPKVFKEGCGYHAREAETNVTNPICPLSCGYCLNHFEAYLLPQWIDVRIYERDQDQSDHIQVQWQQTPLDATSCPLAEKLVAISTYYVPSWAVQNLVGNLMMVHCNVVGSRPPPDSTILH